MQKIYRKYWKPALFALIGAGLGFAYWRFVGCTSGSCPITANWHTSTLFGGLIGMLAAPAKKRQSAGKESAVTEKGSGSAAPQGSPDRETPDNHKK